MKAGKLSESILKRSVLKQLHTKSDSAWGKPALGEDCAVIGIAEDEVLVLSTDPQTITVKELGRVAVISAMNDIASSGAKPVGIMVSVLLPTSANEADLREMMKQVDGACEQLHAAVLGGHTEVTRAVVQPLITVTGVGTVKKDQVLFTSDIRPGMDILLTKWIGLEGTAVLAEQKEEELLTRFSKPFVERAKAFWKDISIWPEAAVAVKSGVSAMHDLSEGGIFGGLWEIAECAGVGLEIDLHKIPIRQETVEICEFFDINPYKLLSAGSMLMAAEDGNQVLHELELAGIQASLIGKTTDGNDRVLLSEGEKRFLETIQTDEIHKMIK